VYMYLFLQIKKKKKTNSTYLRTFRIDCVAILAATCSGKEKCSRVAIPRRICITCCGEGAGTRIPRHRDRTGSITLDKHVATRISRQVAVYFSIVRRNAACASFVKRSTSDSKRTFHGLTFLLAVFPPRYYYKREREKE
jgi:hypothetical protein